MQDKNLTPLAQKKLVGIILVVEGYWSLTRTMYLAKTKSTPIYVNVLMLRPWFPQKLHTLGLDLKLTVSSKEPL